MPIATGLAIGLGVAAAAGSVGAAAIGAHAAGSAANAQSNAADYAANLQKQEADQALAFQKQQWETQQQNMAPWLQAGKQDLATLQGQLPNLSAPFTQQFQAPTNVTEQNDPGYQFRLQQGLQMLDNSAAAKGGLLSGNTLQGEQNYAQNYASNEYGNVYNRAFQQYQNQFNIDAANKARAFNDYASLAGLGQTTAQQLGQQGQAAANNVGNIDLTTGAQQGADLQNAAAARASGYVGGANAWSGALSGGTNNLMDLILLSQMNQGGNNGAWPAAPTNFGL